MKCGHHSPSDEATSHTAISPYELKNNYELQLKEVDDAEIKLPNGVQVIPKKILKNLIKFLVWKMDYGLR